MIQEYKKIIDKQHVSSELMENTIAKMNTYEQHSKFRRKFNIWKVSLAVAVICVVLVGIGIYKDSTRLIYNEVNQTIFKDITVIAPYEKQSSISIDEYEKYIDIDFNTVLPGYEVRQTDIKVSYDDKGEIVSDIGYIYYEAEEEKLLLTVSRTQEISQVELLKGKGSKIGKTQVWLGFNNNTDMKYATFKVNKVNYSLSSSIRSRKQFEEIVENFLKNMQPN